MPDHQRLRVSRPDEMDEDMSSEDIVDAEKQMMQHLYGGMLGDAWDTEYGHETNYTDEGDAFPPPRERSAEYPTTREGRTQSRASVNPTKEPSATQRAKPIEKMTPKAQKPEEDDSVPVETSKKISAVKKAGGLKLLVILFLLFVFVSSDVFVNNVLSLFGGTVQGRNPTSWGVMLQGIFLVIGFILFSHLIENKTI